jgi:phosphoribosylaminoimidazolecarboxamide formyltransferase/IMP cyclohydrolase
MRGKTMTDKIDKSTRAQYRTQVEEDFPESLTIGAVQFSKKLSMRYGENPGYPAAFYREEGAVGPNMGTLKVLQQGSKGLGYINVGDMDLGQRLARKLTSIFSGEKVCVLIKHEMPSGVAMGGDSKGVFLKAWGCDPLSNFGSVDVFNYTVDGELAEAIVEKGRNVEVVYAPEYTPDALEVLAGRKPLRVVKMGAPLDSTAYDQDIEIKRVAGTSSEDVEVVSKRGATPEELEAAVFNWTVACFTRSNAIVIGTRDKVHGIGSGQRSRIDAAENAVKFSGRGYGSEGCVMASDAFMPFPDVVELAAANSITALIYPLGAIRDNEIIARADELDLAMIATRRPGEPDSERCFLHR